MLKIFSCFLLALIASFPLLDAQPFNMRVKGEKAILYNPKNGAVLFQKRGHELHYPSSTTKVPVVFYALEGKPNLDRIYVASKKAVEVIDAEVKQAEILKYPSYLLEHDGVVMGLQEGERMSLRKLLYAMMLISSNDAANVVAEGLGGSVKRFMAGCNSFLKERGVKETQLQNPHGLFHPAHVTTPYEMAVIAGMASENLLFLEIAGSEYFQDEIHNRNKLIREGEFRYPNALWGKTGYVGASGYNLVAVAEKKGRRLVCVLFGYEEPDDRYRDAIALFERAFREKEVKRPLFAKGDSGFIRKLKEGTLRARIDSDVTLCYFPSEEQPIQARLVWHKLSFPVKEGDLVGRLEVTSEEGHLLTSTPLFASHPLDKPKDGRLKVYILLGAVLATLFLTMAKKRRRK